MSMFENIFYKLFGRRNNSQPPNDGWVKRLCKVIYVRLHSEPETYGIFETTDTYIFTFFVYCSKLIGIIYNEYISYCDILYIFFCYFFTRASDEITSRNFTILIICALALFWMWRFRLEKYRQPEDRFRNPIWQTDDDDDDDEAGDFRYIY